MLVRGLPVFIQIGLMIFCLLDCLQSPTDEVRNLPRWAWMALILLVPVVGGISWLLAGRPVANGSAGPGLFGDRSPAGGPPGARPGAPLGPDDDPDFLRELERRNAELRRSQRPDPPDPPGYGDHGPDPKRRDDRA